MIKTNGMINETNLDTDKWIWKTFSHKLGKMEIIQMCLWDEETIQLRKCKEKKRQWRRLAHKAELNKMDTQKYTIQPVKIDKIK